MCSGWPRSHIIFLQPDSLLIKFSLICRKALSGEEWIESEFWKRYTAWSSQDRETLVQPLQSCLRNDGTDFPAVFYGEWHQTKLLGPCDTRVVRKQHVVCASHRRCMMKKQCRPSSALQDLQGPAWPSEGKRVSPRLRAKIFKKNGRVKASKSVMSTTQCLFMPQTCIYCWNLKI